MKHQPFIHILSVCLLFLSHTASGYAQSETLSEKLIVQKAVNLMEQGRYAESRALLEKMAQSKISGEERFHASPLICCDRFEIHRSKEFVRPEAKLLRLAGEVARRAGGVSHAQE